MGLSMVTVKFAVLVIHNLHEHREVFLQLHIETLSPAALAILIILRRVNGLNTSFWIQNSIFWRTEVEKGKSWGSPRTWSKVLSFQDSSETISMIRPMSRSRSCCLIVLAKIVIRLVGDTGHSDVHTLARLVS